LAQNPAGNYFLFSSKREKKIITCARGRCVVTSDFSIGDQSDQRVNRSDNAVCKRPGCGKPLPANKGRGRTRQFCSNECARRYHNAARIPSSRTSRPDTENSLAALDSLIRQATVLVRAALDQAATVDPAQVRARLAEAEAARLRAEVLASSATARAAEAQQQIEVLAAALAAAREETRVARAELEHARVRPGRAGRVDPGGGNPEHRNRASTVSGD
jgi:hypothetical protein